MHEFPHHYKVGATSGTDGDVTVTSPGLDSIPSQPPAEFGGPGDRWSPETLLAAAVADCFILSFRAIARASKLAFVNLEVDVDAVLDRVERQMLFTEMNLTANLTLPEGVDAARAERLLEKAEQTCLVTNSLSSRRHLTARVQYE